MKFGRRETLLGLLFGGGCLGLRALATGLPMAVLADPVRAAEGDCGLVSPDAAQRILLATSSGGDPLNNNAPGTYLFDDIIHPLDPAMEKTALTIGGVEHHAAKPWSTLPATVLDRAAFVHHATRTNNHANQSKVMRLMGDTKGQEMFVSMLASRLAPCLGTVQVEPLTLGATNPLERLTYLGRMQPNLTPTALRDMLAKPDGPLAAIQQIRDADLDRMNAIFRERGTKAQRNFIDKWALSQGQARELSNDLIEALGTVSNDGIQGQITAAAILLKMNVSPVVSIHIDFGGDNHNDNDLVRETNATVNGVAQVALVQQALADFQLQDKVTFVMMNVFGRNLKPADRNGRTHHADHHCTVIIGPTIKSGVYGGVTPSGDDYAAQTIDSATGQADEAGDIPLEESLGAVAKTIGRAVGLSDEVLDEEVVSGNPITGALI